MDAKLIRVTTEIGKVVKDAVGKVVRVSVSDLQPVADTLFIKLYNREIAKKLFKVWNREYREEKEYDFSAAASNCEIIYLKEKLDKILEE